MPHHVPTREELNAIEALPPSTYPGCVPKCRDNGKGGIHYHPCEIASELADCEYDMRDYGGEG